MAEINILSPHLADLIAAGEVVERPASVIKELMENSFDAGARSVTVEIKDGGLTFMRVVDDGTGMLPEDAGICFLRHATSKLRDQQDLDRIGTMGFRGEALAAIASVSDIELLTRKKDSGEGIRLLVSSGDIEDMAPWGCPEGTSVTVSGLFRNTPARLKFLKSDKAEASACALAALRCALGRPEISVRFIRDGKEEFFSPGDSRQDSCVYSLLGRDLAATLLPCKLQDEHLSVTGFVGSPSAGHGNRSKQFFFCGGRSIRSPLIQAALEQAYKNTLLTGRFPACVLWLDISPSAVDVNVHPAKTEVRFRDEKRVFDAVYHAVLAALEQESGSRQMKLFPDKAPAAGVGKVTSSPGKKGEFFRSMSSGEFLKKQSFQTAPRSRAEKPAFPDPTPIIRSASDALKSPLSGAIVIDSSFSTSRENVIKDSFAPYFTGNDSPGSIPPSPIPEDAPVPEVVRTFPLADECDFRLVGEAMGTYIIVEQGDKLIFIDKHAAHERMIFDRLKADQGPLMAQNLLEPVVIKANAEDQELVEKSAFRLRELGLELEPWGEDSLILRAIPADMDIAQAEPLVEDICEKLKTGMRLPSEDAREELLHTIACKAAIKAGRSHPADEPRQIAEAVLSGKVKYCPHGRPVSISLTKKQLDKEFSRIV